MCLVFFSVVCLPFPLLSHSLFCLFSGLQKANTSALFKRNHVLSSKSASPAARHLSGANCVTGLTLSGLTQAFVVRHVSPPESGPWFTNQPCVQCALDNPTHNSAMVTERMKTSASWQQINGSLSPRISRTLNKI